MGRPSATTVVRSVAERVLEEGLFLGRLLLGLGLVLLLVRAAEEALQAPLHLVAVDAGRLLDLVLVLVDGLVGLLLGLVLRGVLGGLAGVVHHLVDGGPRLAERVVERRRALGVL